MKQLVLREILSSPMMNVDHIYRYSGTKLVEPESLAIHIYETMMLGYMIIDNILAVEPTESIDKHLYLEKALHHDMEESMTGDVARPLKYHNSSVRRELNKVASEVARSLYKEYFLDPETFFLWDEAKDGNEGLVLKIADMLTVVNKAIKEVKFLGNMYCLKVVYEVQYYISELLSTLENKKSTFKSEKTVLYLKSLLFEAEVLLKEILNQYSEDTILMDTIPNKTVLDK